MEANGSGMYRQDPAPAAAGSARALDVLLVEDSPEYRQIVEHVLARSGHRVSTAGTAAAALALLARGGIDLVLLDLTLPDGDGLEVCRRIRETSDVHVIMLTGRSEEVDKLLGFRLGADDYVTKPFSPRELSARVDAVARRILRPTANSEELRIGEVRLSPVSREVSVNGNAMELTRLEFDLLETFLRSPRVVQTRTMLLERVWGGEWFGDDHVVDVHVANLRKKLKAAGADNIVRTVRGVGYGLSPEQTRTTIA